MQREKKFIIFSVLIVVLAVSVFAGSISQNILKFPEVSTLALFLLGFSGMISVGWIKKAPIKRKHSTALSKDLPLYPDEPSEKVQY